MTDLIPEVQQGSLLLPAVVEPVVVVVEAFLEGDELRAELFIDLSHAERAIQWDGGRWGARRG